jgi:uncharacterized protein DUF6896
MSAEASDSVHVAISAFSEARAMMANYFDAISAEEIVSSVLNGHRPRAGELGDGATYFVHGIGYTVSLPPERAVHIDASDSGDSFSVYDVQSYLDDASQEPPLELAEITRALDSLVDQGLIRGRDGKNYLL